MLTWFEAVELRRDPGPAAGASDALSRTRWSSRARPRATGRSPEPAGSWRNRSGRGLPPSEALRKTAALPPLLRWVIATGPQQGDLVRQLKQMAARYRAQARLQADKIRLVLPTVLFLAIGMSATLIYSLALFVPMSSLWQALAGPNS